MGGGAGDPLMDRVRIRRGLAVIFESSGVIFAWGSWNKELSGGDSPGVLVPVVRQLDQWRSASEVCAATGLSAAVVMAAIQALDLRGVLEHESYAPARGTSAALSSFFGMMTASGARTQAARGGLGTLSEALVVVIAPGAVAEPVCQTLRDSAVGLVIGGNDTTRPNPPDLAGYSHRLAVVLDDGGDEVAGRVAALLAAGLDGTGIPVLRYYLDNSTVEIGPVLYPGKHSSQQPCFRCARAPGELPSPQISQLEAPLVHVGAAEVAREVMAILGAAGNVTSVRRVKRTEWPRVKTISYLVVPDTDCYTCYPARRHGAGIVIPVLAGGIPNMYEYEVQLPPQRLENTDLAQTDIHREERAASLPRIDPVYESSPRIALPDLSVMDTAVLSHENAHFNRLEVLADLLQRSVGKVASAEASERWAVGGGNLGSVQLYVMSGEAMLGWPQESVFKYDGDTHELLLSSNPINDFQSVLQSACQGISAAWAIIVTVSLGRLAEKYKEFSLRHALLDAACAITKLSAVAAFHQLEMKLAASWSDNLARALEIESEHGEMIVAIAEFREER